MNKWIMIVVIIFCGFCGNLYALELTLSDALERMQNGNGLLQAGQARVESAQSNEKAAFGNFLPVVKLELTAEHLDRDLVLDLDPIREAMLQLQSRDAVTQQSLAAQMAGTPMTPAQQAQFQAGAYQQLDAAVPHFLDTVKTQNHWLGNVVVYQPLFHGGKIIAANRVASSRTKVATSDRTKQEADLRRDFTKYYLQASILRASIRLRQQALEAMSKHRERAQVLVSQGMTDRTALLRAQLAIADGQTALADDSVKLQSLAITLAQMSGVGDPVLPLDSLPAPPYAPASSEQLSEQIASRNPLLASLQAQAELADRAVDVKNADFMPEIGAFGKYELNQSALSSLEPNWVVGVKGTMTLFRGGNDFYSRQSSKATVREVKALQNEARRSLDAQLHRQLLALEQARLRYTNQSSQLELAEENHRITVRRFEEGQATSLEVVDAWLQLQKVQLERVATSGEAWNALLEIYWAAGTTAEFTQVWKGVQK